MGQFLGKYRGQATLGYSLLLVLIGLVANMFVPNIGIPFSIAGIVVVIAFIVLSALTGLVNMLLDVEKNGARLFAKYFFGAFDVLVIASWLTPLANMIVNWLPI